MKSVLRVHILLVLSYLHVADSQAQPRNPQAVTNITLRYVNGGVVLQWKHEDSVTASDLRYVVRYRKTAGQPADWQEVQTQVKEVMLAPLDAGQTYNAIIAVTAGGATSPSSPTLTFTIPTPPPSSLPAPTNFAATVAGPSTVHLRWDPVLPTEKGVYYSLKTVQLDVPNARETYKYVQSTSILLDQLLPGASYQFELRARLRDEESSVSSVEIKMPTGTVSVAQNLTVSTRTEEPELHVLTWTVNGDRSKIASSVVWYTQHRNATEWSHVRVTGSQTEALIPDLKPSMEYYVKIETEFNDGRLTSMSNTYKFRTPDKTFVKNLQTVYTADGNVKLEWSVFDKVINMSDIIGYRVLWTKDRSLPEERWNQSDIIGREATLTLGSPAVLGEIFVQIFIATNSGFKKDPSIFRFHTTQLPVLNHMVELTPSMQVVYRRVGKQDVQLRWQYPPEHLAEIAGALVLYTDDPSLPEEQWTTVMVTGPNRTDVTLVGLNPSHEYLVKIRPKMSDGRSISGTGVYRISALESSSQSPQSSFTIDLAANKTSINYTVSQMLTVTVATTPTTITTARPAEIISTMSSNPTVTPMAAGIRSAGNIETVPNRTISNGAFSAHVLQTRNDRTQTHISALNRRRHYKETVDDNQRRSPQQNITDQFCLTLCTINEAGVTSGCPLGQLCVPYCERSVNIQDCRQGWCLPHNLVAAARRLNLYYGL